VIISETEKISPGQSFFAPGNFFRPKVKIFFSLLVTIYSHPMGIGFLAVKALDLTVKIRVTYEALSRT